MSKLLELAERCEAATGPDRQLDNAIANAIRRPLLQGEPFYTASLDAAMTLVPEGWRVSQWREYGHGGIEAELKRRSAIQYERGEAGSFALALCAAALRARASQERTGNG